MSALKAPSKATKECTSCHKPAGSPLVLVKSGGPSWYPSRRWRCSGRYQAPAVREVSHYHLLLRSMPCAYHHGLLFRSEMLTLFCRR